MQRCRTCLIPRTRPDTYFDESGNCSACVNYGERQSINWDKRREELCRLISRHVDRHREFDCIVPSSGGKDSTAQVIALLALGVKPLVVTATTCMLTPVGRANIDNLARYATTIEVSPNKTVRAILNRAGLQLVGDISWPEHVAIFTTPFKIAVQMGIPLIFYGESPQREYGGPPGSEETKIMTRRWVSEFGGFLGLRPADLITYPGLNEKNLREYLPPSAESIDAVGVEAHFLGQYLPWDSHANAECAVLAGMQFDGIPTEANLWRFENLDNAMTGLHDHMMYRKYGYGRGCAQISVDVRTGRQERMWAESWVRTHDGLFPWQYMGVKHTEVLEHIGITDDYLLKTMDRFTNHAIFDRTEDRRPILIG
jgi:N-acetyl sugar amidotransferase